MRIFLFVLAVLAFLLGFGVLVAAASAIQEIEAFVLFVCASVLLSGASIVEAVTRLADRSAHSTPGLKSE
jgi:hypothetical protein